MGLAMMFKEANFEILEIGQWGNYEYISRLFQTHSWPGYNVGYLPENNWISRSIYMMNHRYYLNHLSQ